MSLTRAIKAFCREWNAPACQHGHVIHHHEHCPDCGQVVAVMWVQLRCQRCGMRRKPKQSGGITHQAVEPLERHCRFCGESKVHHLSQQHIPRGDLLWSVLKKQTYQQEEKTLTANIRAQKSLMSYLRMHPPTVHHVSQVLDVVIR